jgi:hypothetical protein
LNILEKKVIPGELEMSWDFGHLILNYLNILEFNEIFIFKYFGFFLRIKHFSVLKTSKINLFKISQKICLIISFSISGCQSGNLSLSDFPPEMTLENHGNLLLENILNLGVGTLQWELPLYDEYISLVQYT